MTYLYFLYKYKLDTTLNSIENLVLT